MIKNHKAKKSSYKRKYSSIENAIQAITIGNYPPDEELVDLVWQKSLISLSKSFKVTDNAIRNRCRRRNIPLPPVGYWRKLECGKVEECQEMKKQVFHNWTGINKDLKYFSKW